MDRHDISNSSESDVSLEQEEPDSPTPGPSTSRPESPIAGPSFASDPRDFRSSQPPRRHLISRSSSEDSINDDEPRNFRHKNQKRPRIEYRNLSREPRSPLPNDLPRYTHSPPIETGENSDTETIFENRSFKVRLRQVEHRRNSRFNISDHLYDMTFEVKDNRQFLLQDLFELINSALIKAISQLKEKYPNNYRNQLFTTIVQDGLLNGLNSGGYSMATNPQQIANHMLNMLESFVQSNEALTLNDSFKIVMKVISMEHVSHRILNDDSYVPHVARNEQPGHFLNRTYPDFIHSEKGYCKAHERFCFDQDCVHLCILIALSVKGISQYPKNDEELHTKIELLKSQSDLGMENTLMMASKNYFLQFHIFDADLNFQHAHSYPSEIDYSLNQIYLCLFNNQSHLTYISDYQRFCRINKKYTCFSCQKQFKSKVDFFHRCQKIETCFACCRPLAKENFLIDCDRFCDVNISRPEQVVNEQCQRCNLILITKSCGTFHSRVCRRGFKFECCNTYTYKSSFSSNISEIKAKHVCTRIKCSHCRGHLTSTLDENHQCIMKKHNPSKKMPTLGFIHFLKENTSGLNCYLCSQSKKKCDFHSAFVTEGTFQPCFCSLWVPKSASEFSLSEFSIYFPPKKNKEIIAFDYTQFISKPDMNCTHEFSELKSKPEKTLPMKQQIMQFFASENINNMTFLCNCYTGEMMIFILDMLLSVGLAPKIVNAHNSILLIKVNEIKLRFLNLANFLPKNDPVAFFPETFIHVISVVQNLVPSLSHYFLKTDSKSLREKKRQFFEKIDFSKWDFYTEMAKFAKKYVEHAILQCILYLNAANSFQKKCYSYFGKDFFFIHPFADSLSKNGYIFKLFQVMRLNDFPIHAIPREYTGVFNNMSKSEAEFVAYLNHCNPSHNIVTGFSALGQLKFKATVPDAVDLTSKTAYYFHGCHFHLHDPDICHIKKCNAEKSKEKREEFEKKTARLLRDTDQIHSIVVQWECDWLEKRKHGALRDFLSTSYVDRPKRRLIPRDAG